MGRRPLTKSEQMARVRRRDTGAECHLRSLLWAAGLRYRVQAQTHVGKPDIVFPGPKVAVFVDGCFWHGCPEHYTLPRRRQDFWTAKLRRNVGRDKRQTKELERLEWRVLRIWEHEVFNQEDEVVERVYDVVKLDKVDERSTWRVAWIEPLDEGRERVRLESLRDEKQVFVRKRA